MDQIAGAVLMTSVAILFFRITNHCIIRGPVHFSEDEIGDDFMVVEYDSKKDRYTAVLKNMDREGPPRPYILPDVFIPISKGEVYKLERVIPTVFFRKIEIEEPLIA